MRIVMGMSDGRKKMGTGSERAKWQASIPELPARNLKCDRNATEILIGIRLGRKLVMTPNHAQKVMNRYLQRFPFSQPLPSHPQLL